MSDLGVVVRIVRALRSADDVDEAHQRCQLRGGETAGTHVVGLKRTREKVAQKLSVFR